jgi:hypothetical protein
MQLLDFNGIALPDRSVAYEIPATVAVSRMAITGAIIGGYALGAHHETRKYRVDGAYLRSATTPTDADAKIDQLRASMGITGVLRQKMRDGSIRRCNAWLTAMSPTHDNLSAISQAQRLVADFEADSFWYSDSLIVIEPSSSLTMLAINEGNAVTRQIKFTLSPAANVASLTLTCGSVSLVYGAALTTSDVLVIDVAAGTVTKNGVNVYGNTSRPDTQMALFELAANSENEITASAAVTGRVEYRECWI